jgi:membrane-associated phospholipid phosphatase
LAVSGAVPGARAPLFVAGLSLAVFALLGFGVWEDSGGFGWDASVAGFVADVVPVSDEEVHIDAVITVITAAVGIATALLVVGLLLRRRFRAAFFPIAAVGVTGLLTTLIKAGIERPAIEGPGESSFPSGTAAWSMALVAALVLLAPPSRRLVLGVVGAVLLVALSGVIVWEEWHYPSDVLAGWCLALGCALTLWLALGRPTLASPSESHRESPPEPGLARREAHHREENARATPPTAGS